MRQVASLNYKYEVDKKENELEVLQKDIENQSLALERQKDLRNFLMILSGLLLVIVALVFKILQVNLRNNRRLSEVNQEIQEKNQQLLELNSAKDKLFSIIGHDLKGPLNALSGFSELMLNHIEVLSPAETKKIAFELNNSVTNLGNLLENLLLWAGSQTGRINYLQENLDLRPLIDDCIQLLLPSASNKKIVLDSQVEDDAFALSDRNSIKTVVRNLVSNAIKFTPENGKVKISAFRKNDLVEISVSDNGVGISSEKIGRLFEIGQKNSTPGTRNEKGTGLGLMMCKEFVEKNKGRIFVESSPGQGSNFIIQLPAADPIQVETDEMVSIQEA